MIDTVGLSKNGFHFLLGIFVYLGAAKVFKIKLSSAKSLIAPAVFALLMEVMDFRDATAYGSHLNWVDSANDSLLTISLPLTIWIYIKLRNRF